MYFTQRSIRVQAVDCILRWMELFGFKRAANKEVPKTSILSYGCRKFQRVQMFCWCEWLVKMEYGIFHSVPETQGAADHATNPNASRVFTNHLVMLR